MNTIAVDAMGGDSAPVEIVKGAIKAKENGVNVVLCGDENLIKPYLGPTEIPVYHFPQVISMDEDPLKAVRSKKEASINGCMQLLKEKKVEAVFSAGNLNGRRSTQSCKVKKRSINKWMYAFVKRKKS